MLDPPLVAEGVAALREGGLPVTVKCRLGVDEQDSYEALCAFVATVAKAGPLLFIVHARKAWLSGLSPKENRERPKLHYDWVYRLRQDFPQLRFVLNGGLTTAAAMEEVLPLVDGVMVGRAFYDQPYLLAECEAALGGGPRLDRQEILLRYLPYVEGHLKAGVPLAPLVRPLLNLFHGIPNARRFRRILSEGMFRPGADLSLLHHALTVLTTLEPVTIV
jgi:tRNA-dihydrouridine synthase A